MRRSRWTEADVAGYDARRGQTVPTRAGDVLRIDLEGTATAPRGTRRLTFPRMRLESEANRRDHWTVKHARAKEQRYTVYYNLRCTFWSLPTLPCTITLTRIAPRLLDGQELKETCEAVCFGVADWLAGAEGEGQPEQDGLFWKYEQQQGKPREHSLWITIIDHNQGVNA